MENILKIEGYELLSQKVYHLLKTEIVKGTLKPGDKLLEEKIATQMGISRTPIREALRELVAEGFVKMNPNQGISVKMPIPYLSEIPYIGSIFNQHIITYISLFLLPVS